MRWCELAGWKITKPEQVLDLMDERDTSNAKCERLRKLAHDLMHEDELGKEAMIWLSFKCDNPALAREIEGEA